METKKIADISWYVVGNVLVKCERFKYQGVWDQDQGFQTRNQSLFLLFYILFRISCQCHDHRPNIYVHGVDKMSIKIIFAEFETFFSLFIYG